MRFGNYALDKDGETIVVSVIGVNKKTDAETKRPIAYVRGVLEGLQSIQRKMTVAELEKAKDIRELVSFLKTQQEMLLSTVKSGCRECLK